MDEERPSFTAEGALEAWEFELEAWSADPNREPRKSTVTKLRLRLKDAK
jgi:hypothetical protein